MIIHGWPRYVGPALTVGFTLIYHYGVINHYYEVSLALIFLFVAGGAFISGLRGGLAAAAWGSAYGFYVMLPGSRLVQTILGMIGLAGLVGYGTRRLRAEYQRRQVETAAKLAALEQLRQIEAIAGDRALDTNLSRIEQVEKLGHDLYWQWEQLSDSQRRELAKTIWDRANNIVSLAEGWRQIGRYQFQVMRDNEQSS